MFFCLNKNTCFSREDSIQVINEGLLKERLGPAEGANPEDSTLFLHPPPFIWILKT